MFNTFYVIFSDIFALFPVQKFKTEVLTAQKNILFECLLETSQVTSGSVCANPSMGPAPLSGPTTKNTLICVTSFREAAKKFLMALRGEEGGKGLAIKLEGGGV